MGVAGWGGGGLHISFVPQAHVHCKEPDTEKKNGGGGMGGGRGQRMPSKI